jgi:hypothetical protein
MCVCIKSVCLSCEGVYVRVCVLCKRLCVSVRLV